MTVGCWYVFPLLSFSLAFFILYTKKFLSPWYINLWPLLYIISILISMLAAGYTSWTLIEFYFLIPNIVIYYIAVRINPVQQKQLIRAMVVTAFIICLYSIYQYFFGLKHTFEYLSQTQRSGWMGEILKGKRVFATFVSPNIFASYVLMMLFTSIGLLIEKKGAGKIIYWIGTIAMALSLLYTKSFGGLLTLGATLLLSLPYILPYFIEKKHARRSAFLIILIVAVFLGISSSLFFGRLSQLFDLQGPHNSVTQRFHYWKASIDMLRHSPFSGIGWRRFGEFYISFRPQSANVSHYSHNVFLQTLVETGPLGLAALVALITTFLINGLRVLGRDAEKRALRMGLFYGGCAFLIHNLTDLSFYFSQASYFWWLIAGLFTNYRLAIRSGKEQGRQY
ncbi:MAG: O-antigen ligase family protein [Candidatus Omnitrophica bacterium]|nr:O-antigen ligase family protein [Candidatus Omnitrophota bacterium]